MPSTLTAARLHTPGKSWTNPVITIDDDGLIRSIETASSSTDDTVLVPTFFDVHIHGTINYDVMEASPDAFAEISHFLATKGVGHFLPTTITAAVDVTLRALERIADEIEKPQHSGAIPLGLHLEGPFLSHAKRGVHPPEYLLPPSIELFDRFQQAARGHVRLITVAPESPGAIDFIRYATAQGVRVSIGHSNAIASEARAAIAAGAASATHTFNAMRPLDHRDPGILGVVLDDNNLFAELICDGVHVVPELVRLFLKAKTVDRGILITDGLSATGMPEGIYKLGNFEIEVVNGRAQAKANGVLAGSVLTMDRAVANLVSFTGIDISDATKLASSNPARMLGLADQLSLDVGKPANFNRYTTGGTLHSTILNGKQVV